MWRRKPVKAILFDIGGVVVHAKMQGYLQVASMMFGCQEQELSVHFSSRFAELERGEIDSYSLWEDLGLALQNDGIGKAQAPEKLDHLWAQLLEESLQVDHAMLDLCRHLKSRLPIGALSNTIREHATHLQSLGVYESFNPCILSFEVGMRKPERDIYLKAADLLNTPPQNCLLVDDLEENIRGAKASKMQAHLFTSQSRLESELQELGLL